MIVARDKDGNVVNKGDIIKDFRGDEWRFDHGTLALDAHKSAKVTVWCLEPDLKTAFAKREFYDHVFDITVNKEDNDT